MQNQSSILNIVSGSEKLLALFNFGCLQTERTVQEIYCKTYLRQVLAASTDNAEVL